MSIILFIIAKVEGRGGRGGGREAQVFDRSPEYERPVRPEPPQYRDDFRHDRAPPPVAGEGAQ